ncbi:hypothetical protein H8E77_42865 [bacterium]|nr:hypothetical protein [bacterium]
MKPETKKILDDPELIEVREAHFMRLEALYAGEKLENEFILQGIGRYTEDDGPDWEKWLDESLDSLAEQAEEAKNPNVFRPLVLNYNPHGVHFVDYLFGADVFLLEGGGWQVRYLESPIGELEYPDLESNDSWQAVTEFTYAFLERDVPTVLFALPTIASTLNIAVNLYGQKILEAMLLEPEAAQQDLRVINHLLCDIHRWYRKMVPLEQLQCIVAASRCQPPGFGQLCGCTTQLLSPELYHQFIAPLDDELLSVYPYGGMIHLCGTHTQHIPVWREMTSLRAVQTNDIASEDLEKYFNELRDDQILYVNHCEGMPADRIRAITKGRRVVYPR